MERTTWHFWVSEWLVNSRVPFFDLIFLLLWTLCYIFGRNFDFHDLPPLPVTPRAHLPVVIGPFGSEYSQLSLYRHLSKMVTCGLVLPLFSFFRLPSKPASGVARGVGGGGMGCPCAPTPSGEGHPNVPSLTTLKTKANGPSKIVADTPDYEPASLGCLW